MSAPGSTSTAAVEARLAAAGLRLPRDLPPPAGAYDPWRLHRGFGFLAAQVPGGAARLGRIGAELTPEEGRAAARAAALNAVGRLHEALGDLDRLEGVLHVAGHVAAADGFLDAPAVLDGASELLALALEERGRHTRTAYLAARLPLDVAIELEITFAYREG